MLNEHRSIIPRPVHKHKFSAPRTINTSFPYRFKRTFHLLIKRVCWTNTGLVSHAGRDSGYLQSVSVFLSVCVCVNAVSVSAFMQSVCVGVCVHIVSVSMCVNK